MPELPEVETVRRDLEAEIVGKTIADVVVTGLRSVRRQDRKHFIDELRDRRIEGVRRRGKFLFIDLQDEMAVVAHLRMSGQFQWVEDPKGTPNVKHTHVVWRFTTGEELRFVDPRTFGEMWVTSQDAPEIAHIGPDALEIADATAFRARLGERRSNIKAVLLNQEIVAGVGNIYADETLWRSKIRPEHPVAELTTTQKNRIFKEMVGLLQQAVDARGSTLRDARYVDAYGMSGDAQSLHHVYDREDKSCDRCGEIIIRTQVAGRSSYWCPNCQK